MSRNEMFLLLAIACVAAIVSSPVPWSHQHPVTIASLLAPPPDAIAWNRSALNLQAADQR